MKLALDSSILPLAYDELPIVVQLECARLQVKKDSSLPLGMTTN
jgi:hypothetical protein